MGCVYRNVSAQDTLDENETIHRAYPAGGKIVRVDHDDRPPLYRFEAPYFPLKSYDRPQVEWENHHLAELYADVWCLTSLREEKTGPRGIPPEVERAGRDVVVAYLTTMPGVGIDYLTHHYDVTPETIYQYRSRVRDRAEEWREEYDGGDRQ